MAATKVHNDRKSCLDLLFDVACGSESKAMKMWSIVGEKCTFFPIFKQASMGVCTA
jgi:hypothetical protein